METVHTVKKTLFAVCLGAIGLSWASAGLAADTMKFNHAPASNVISEMGRRLGITIVLRSTVDMNQPVTFSVDDPNSPAGRLEAVNDLANVLGMDFQKVYVVSKIDAGALVPEVKIDSSGAVVFPSTKVGAREAIQTVAAVDGALAQISGAVQGDVTFPNRRMSAPDAAALIAKQTQTGWKAYYGLYRRGEIPSRLEGVVVDQTNLGQPITELPLLSFRDTNPPAPVDTTGTTTAGGTTTPNGTPGPAGAPSSGGTPNGYLPYGADPYATNPYAYNPYMYGNPYGYDPYGGSGYGGMGYGSGGSSGFDNTIGGGTPVFGGGPSVFTLPNNSASFQSGFSFGGPVTIGGY